MVGKVWLEDASMIRPLAFHYAEDPQVYDIGNQSLFGDSIMVCPIVEPTFFQEKKSIKIYLPKGNGWFDYWSHKYYEGNQWITLPIELTKIPLFVKEDRSE